MILRLECMALKLACWLLSGLEAQTIGEQFAIPPCLCMCRNAVRHKLYLGANAYCVANYIQHGDGGNF
jgi:hypothetical protein